MSQIKKIGAFLWCAFLQGCAFWRDTPPPLADNSLAHYYAVRLPQDLREAYGDSWREVQKAIEAFWKRVQDCILRHDAAAFADLIQYPCEIALRDPAGPPITSPYVFYLMRSKEDLKRFFSFIFHPIRKNFAQADDWRYTIWHRETIELYWANVILHAKVKNLHSRDSHLYGQCCFPTLIVTTITLTGDWTERTYHEILQSRRYQPERSNS